MKKLLFTLVAAVLLSSSAYCGYITRTIGPTNDPITELENEVTIQAWATFTMNTIVSGDAHANINLYLYSAFKANCESVSWNPNNTRTYTGPISHAVIRLIGDDDLGTYSARATISW